MEPNTTQEKSNGALIGLVVVVIILIIGGIYIWQSNKNADMMPADGNGTVTSEDAASLDALDKDVESTDTSTGVDVNTVY